jgi:branched-subunit amino acid ABC-type transport system permease component
VIRDLTIAGLGSGGLYCLLATGFALIYRPTHQLHIAYGVVALTGGYLFGSLTTSAGLPLVLALPLAVLIGAALGSLVEALLYRPLIASPLSVLLTSFGVVYVGQNLLQWVYGPGSVRPDVSDRWSDTVDVGIGQMSWIQIMLFGCAVVVAAAIMLALQRTSLGRALRALSIDREMAEVTGLPVKGLTTLCYALGSGISTLAVCIRAMDVGVSPTGSVSLVLTAFVGAVVFGQRLILAPVGGFAVGFLITALLYFVSGEYQTTSVYVCLIVLLFGRALTSRANAARKQRSYARDLAARLARERASSAPPEDVIDGLATQEAGSR